MRLKVTYIDTDSYTVEEAIGKAKHIFGTTLQDVEVLPETNSIEDFLYFALQSIVTPNQLSEFFDGTNNLTQVRAEALDKVHKVLNKVIIENEEKLISD